MRKYLVELCLRADGLAQLAHQREVWAESRDDAIQKAKQMWPDYWSYNAAQLGETWETK